MLCQQPHDRGAGADLYVVAVRADAEDAQRPVGRLRETQLQHG
jgi:hypothetical protein